MKQKTIRQSIIDDDGVATTARSGLDQVDYIKKCHTAVSTAEKILADFERNGIGQTKDKLESRQDEIAFEVSKDPELKNDTQRKAAMARFIADDVECQKLKAELHEQEIKKAELEQDVYLAKIDLETARNTFVAWQHQMAVVAGLSNENACTVTVKHTMEVNSHVEEN